MKIIFAVLSMMLLAACGVETAATAAASAEIKKREMNQAKQIMDQTKQKIEQNTQRIMERAAQAEEKAKD